MLDASFLPRRRVPVVLQNESAECGLACLAMVAAWYGRATPLSELRRLASASLRGTTLKELLSLAGVLELSPRALRLELAQLSALRCPAVLHWGFDHFVVLERVSRTAATLVDPAVGRRRLSLAEVSRQFTGVALELVPNARFERRAASRELPLSAFFRGVRGLAGALTRILVLSLVLQALLLLSPLFAQLVIDDVVQSGDRELLTVLGIAFSLLVVLQAAVQCLRSWLVIVLGASLELGWGSRLFHHLLRLPLEFFERRHMGDIVSRFGSLSALKQAVSQTVIEGLVDGMLAITAVAVMLWYAPALTAVVLLALTLYALLRAALFRAQRNAAHEALVLGARESSTFMESIRAIVPLKNFGREAQRQARWQNAKTEALNAELQVHRLEVLHATAQTAVFGVAGVVVIWLGAAAILDRELSVGMLVAFLAYQQQLTARAGTLIDRVLELRLVSVHRERLADLALTEPDPALASPSGGRSLRPLEGRLEAKSLVYQYAPHEPPVLADLDFTIAAGECVAIAAPSGRGKTTLIKLLLGLLHPSAGEILVDGMSLRGAMLARYRRQAAAVMQDDALLGGTLAENISFFAPQPDPARVEQCARLAAVHEDIARMPLGYLTRVGDMGSALSGGQRQRLLIARALYARPRVLFLDEATSHLDGPTEQRIHRALAGMKITRVLVTHRQETLGTADRVIALG